MSMFFPNKEATEAVEKSLIERAAAETSASLARYEQANKRLQKPNTCSTCKHWVSWPDGSPDCGHGICVGMKNNMIVFEANKPWPLDANIKCMATAGEFGCILHEPKS